MRASSFCVSIFSEDGINKLIFNYLEANYGPERSLALQGYLLSVIPRRETPIVSLTSLDELSQAAAAPKQEPIITPAVVHLFLPEGKQSLIDDILDRRFFQEYGSSPSGVQRHRLSALLDRADQPFLIQHFYAAEKSHHAFNQGLALILRNEFPRDEEMINNFFYELAEDNLDLEELEKLKKALQERQQIRRQEGISAAIGLSPGQIAAIDNDSPGLLENVGNHRHTLTPAELEEIKERIPNFDNLK